MNPKRIPPDPLAALKAEVMTSARADRVAALLSGPSYRRTRFLQAVPDAEPEGPVVSVHLRDEEVLTLAGPNIMVRPLAPGDRAAVAAALSRALAISLDGLATALLDAPKPTAA